MYSILLAYLILIVYYAVTESRRQGDAAKTLKGGQFDKGSTRLLSLAVAINIGVLIVANALNYFQIGLMVDFIGWIGIAVMFGGITLRVWATQTLGRFYTRTLLIRDDHHIVQDGPYAKVRHPGYLGVILLWLGAGLATVNWIAAALVTFTILAAYRYRIHTEENMLVASFGQDYKQYMGHTWRLLPYVW